MLASNARLSRISAFLQRSNDAQGSHNFSHKDRISAYDTGGVTRKEMSRALPWSEVEVVCWQVMQPTPYTVEPGPP